MLKLTSKSARLKEGLLMYVGELPVSESHFSPDVMEHQNHAASIYFESDNRPFILYLRIHARFLFGVVSQRRNALLGPEVVDVLEASVARLTRHHHRRRSDHEGENAEQRRPHRCCSQCDNLVKKREKTKQENADFFLYKKRICYF